MIKSRRVSRLEYHCDDLKSLFSDELYFNTRLKMLGGNGKIPKKIFNILDKVYDIQTFMENYSE